MDENLVTAVTCRTNVLVAQRCFINMIWRIYNCAKNWVRNIYGKYHKYYVCCHWSLRPTVGVDVLKTKVRQLKFCLTDFSAALLTYFHVCLFLFHWVGKDHPTDVFSPPPIRLIDQKQKVPSSLTEASLKLLLSAITLCWKVKSLRTPISRSRQTHLGAFLKMKDCRFVLIDPYQQNISWRRKKLSFNLILKIVC